MSMHNVYIVLSDTGSFLNRAIKCVTRAPYNHASISLDDTFENLYSFGRKNPNNPFIGGFVEESFYDGTFKRFYNSRCLVLRRTIDEQTYESLRESIRVFSENKDTYHYNFVGLFTNLLRYNLPRKNHYYCSEFVGEVLHKCDAYSWDVPPHQIRPHDFVMDNAFEVVYEGLIREYQ